MSLPFKCHDALASAVLSRVTRIRYRGPIAAHLVQVVRDFVALHKR